MGEFLCQSSEGKRRGRQRLSVELRRVPSHIMRCVLRILKVGGVIAYYFPAHTGGETKHFNVDLFGSIKNDLNTDVHGTQKIRNNVQFNKLDLLQMLYRTNIRAITVPNIINKFKEAGLWPVISEVD